MGKTWHTLRNSESVASRFVGGVVFVTLARP
jgi:hypothetical protein